MCNGNYCACCCLADEVGANEEIAKLNVSDEVSRKEEILKFFEANKHLLPNELRKVQVTVMRHILPQFLMEAYADHYQRYLRKGKPLFNCYDLSCV